MYMSICISDITFAYSVDKPVLSGINIDILKGETLDIVGTSGCGKLFFTNYIMIYCNNLTHYNI